MPKRTRDPLSALFDDEPRTTAETCRIMDAVSIDDIMHEIEANQQSEAAAQQMAAMRRRQMQMKDAIRSSLHSAVRDADPPPRADPAPADDDDDDAIYDGIASSGAESDAPARSGSSGSYSDADSDAELDDEQFIVQTQNETDIIEDVDNKLTRLLAGVPALEAFRQHPQRHYERVADNAMKLLTPAQRSILCSLAEGNAHMSVESACLDLYQIGACSYGHAANILNAVLDVEYVDEYSGPVGRNMVVASFNMDPRGRYLCAVVFRTVDAAVDLSRPEYDISGSATRYREFLVGLDNTSDLGRRHLTHDMEAKRANIATCQVRYWHHFYTVRAVVSLSDESSAADAARDPVEVLPPRGSRYVSGDKDSLANPPKRRVPFDDFNAGLDTIVGANTLQRDVVHERNLY